MFALLRRAIVCAQSTDSRPHTRIVNYSTNFCSTFPAGGSSANLRFVLFSVESGLTLRGLLLTQSRASAAEAALWSELCQLVFIVFTSVCSSLCGAVHARAQTCSCFCVGLRLCESNVRLESSTSVKAHPRSLTDSCLLVAGTSERIEATEEQRQ